MIYIPVNERKFRIRNSENLINDDGFGLKWEDLFEINWKSFFSPFQNFKIYILFIGLIIFTIIALYAFWLLMPFLNGYRFLIGLMTLNMSIIAVSGGMLSIENNDSIIMNQRIMDSIGAYKERIDTVRAHFKNQSHSQSLKFLQMPSTIDFLKFASLILACPRKDISNFLQSRLYRKLLIKQTKVVLQRGARLLYRTGNGVYDILEGSQFTITGDRPEGAQRPVVPQRIFALHILKLKEIHGSILGPTLVMGGTYYPIGGLLIDKYQDEWDFFD